MSAQFTLLGEDAMAIGLRKSRRRYWLIALVFGVIRSGTLHAAQDTPALNYMSLGQRYDWHDARRAVPIDVADKDSEPLSLLGLKDQVCWIEDGERNCWTRPVRRVIRGFRIKPGTRPWQAQIYVSSIADWDRQHWCGGSLVDGDANGGWVLTAAHCQRSDFAKMEDVRVRLGAHNLSEGDGRVYRIDRIVVHAQYDDETNANDIALLHVVPDQGQPTGLAYQIKPITLERPRPGQREWLVSGQPVASTGWGTTRHGGSHSDQLLEGRFQLAPNADCKRVYGSAITPRVICAYTEGSDTCQGDSGGPLTTNYGGPVQIGIVDYGKGCAKKGVPGVYTRVSAYYDWIQAAMRKTGHFSLLADPVRLDTLQPSAR
jgi:Trypsin